MLNISQTFQKPLLLFLSVILLSLYPKAYLVAMILSLLKFDTRRPTTYTLGVHQLNAFLLPFGNLIFNKVVLILLAEEYLVNLTNQSILNVYWLVLLVHGVPF